MEFNQKLQQLRKQRGMTQENLAEALFVSRTAISKWESGRGYPGIDSLKAMAKFFGVTIDELLSGDELLSAAEEDNRQRANRFRNLVFALLDCSTVLFFFLPIFGLKTEAAIRSVSLLNFDGAAAYLKIVYCIVVIAMIASGILSLALQSCRKPFPVGNRLSLALNAAGALIFIISPQPYGAALLFTFLIIKVLLLLKWQ